MAAKNELICFDLDNTLIYSNKVHVIAFEMAFAKNGLRKVSRKKIESLLNGMHAHDVIKKLFPRLDENKVNAIARDHRDFVSFSGKYARKIGNVTKTLGLVRRHYEIALVSNCVHKEINILLRNAKISRELFDYVIGKEDVKHSKPYPDEIVKAEHLARMNADFMVGDSIYDIIAARKARVRVVSVLTGIAKRKEINRYKPDFILNNVNELPMLLSKVNRAK